MDLHNRLEVFQAPAHLLDLLPDIRAGHGAERDQHLGARGFQDFRDLMRLEQRIDGIGDAGRFGAEQRDECLGQQRKQEAHHIAAVDAEGVKHVGGLRHARDEIAMADDDRIVGRVRIGEKLDRGRIGIVGRTQSDGIVGALRGDAICVRIFSKARTSASVAKLGYSLPMMRSSKCTPAMLSVP